MQVSDLRPTLSRIFVEFDPQRPASDYHDAPAGEVIVVRVAGEVDLFTISVLRDALADSLARGPCDLVVDLAGMTFCDARG